MSNPETKFLGIGGINVRPERLRALRPNVVAELVESIQSRGRMINPITVRPRDGGGYWLLAGRHRLEACKKLGYETIHSLVFDDITEANEAELLEVDENLIRADLTPAETALHIDRRKTLYEDIHPDTKHGGAPGKAGGGKKAKELKSSSFVSETAKKTGKSTAKVKIDAKRGKHGRAWLSQVAGTCLDQGNEIDALIELPAEERDKLIAQAKCGNRVSAKLRIKQLNRANREQSLASKITALPDKRYGVIVADPEWRWEPWSRETGLDRAADNHYPTSCTEVIATRPVETIAADNCALFLWATIPMMPHALVVMAAWGFDYVSQYAWGKDKAGTGYWSREKHELLLIGTRGEIACPAPGMQWDSLQISPRLEHSAKPELFLEMIEEYFPNIPKIELNRRGPARPGWDAWGNEAAEATDAKKGDEAGAVGHNSERDHNGHPTSGGAIGPAELVDLPLLQTTQRR